MSFEGSIVYDVRDSGTYLSRRSNIPLPDGMKWCPLLESGPFMITRYSTFPLEVPDVRGGPNNSVVFGDSVVLLSVAPKKVVGPVLSSSDVPFGSASLIGYFQDSPLYQFIGTAEQSQEISQLREWDKGGVKTIVYNDVLVTASGSLLRETFSTWEGYAVSPKDALAISTGLQANKVYRLRVFSDGYFRYIESPAEVHKGYWFFSSLGAVRKYFPQILLYGKMWIGGQVSFRTDELAKNQVSTRRTDTRVREFISSVDIATVPQISTATGIGIGLASLFQLVSKMSGIYWWSGKNMLECKFVTEQFLSKQRFPPSFLEDVPNTFFFVDGKTYLEVVQYIMEQGATALYTRNTLMLKTFARFLRGNPFQVLSSRQYPLYSEIRVRAYRW